MATKNRARDAPRTPKDASSERSRNRRPELGNRNRSGNVPERIIDASVSMKSTIEGWPKSGTSERKHERGRGTENENEQGRDKENATGLWNDTTVAARLIVAVTEEDADRWIEADETAPEIDSGVAAVAEIDTTETVAVVVTEEIAEVVANRKMTSTRIRSARA